MSSFIRVAGHRLTSLVRTSTRSACGSTAVSCRPDELNDVGIELDLRCGYHQRSGKLDGSPKRLP